MRNNLLSNTYYIVVSQIFNEAEKILFIQILVFKAFYKAAHLYDIPCQIQIQDPAETKWDLTLENNVCYLPPGHETPSHIFDAYPEKIYRHYDFFQLTRRASGKIYCLPTSIPFSPEVLLARWSCLKASCITTRAGIDSSVFQSDSRVVTV